jgi:hypothetical protein
VCIQLGLIAAIFFPQQKSPHNGERYFAYGPNYATTAAKQANTKILFCILNQTVKMKGKIGE